MGHNEVWVQAAREGAALVPRKAYGMLRVRGRDRQEFVHSYTTNEVKGLRPGQGCTAAVSNWKGTVTDHVRVLCRPHELLIIGTYGHQGAVKAALERYIIGVDVQIEDVTGRISGLELGGPLALRILPAARDLPLNSHRTVQFAPPLCGLPDADNPLAEPEEAGEVGQAVEPVETAAPGVDASADAGSDAGTDEDDGLRTTSGIVVRTSGFNGGGVMVLVPIEADTAMRDRLRRLGATGIGAEAWELVRIEEGMPEFGRDIGEDTNVWEARLDRSVSLEKGCYLGQEVVARLYNYQRVQRYLMGIRIEGADPVAAGTEVHEGEVAVGMVTSAAPDLQGRILALALIKAPSASSGTRLSVGGRPAVLEDLPFWSACRPDPVGT